MATESSFPEQLEELKNHIIVTCTSLLGVNKATFSDALSTPQNTQTIKAFAESQDKPILFVQKLGESEESSDSYKIVYELTLSKEDKNLGICFIKTVRSLAPNVSIASQVLVCELSGESPYKSVLTYVRSCFLPYVRTITASEEKDTEREKYEEVRRNMQALETTLQKCQLSTEIPDIILEVHPEVIKYLEQLPPNHEPSAEDFADKEEIVREIQQLAERWTKEIASMGSRDWDISSGTTLDEINFWGSKAARLESVRKQLQSTSPGIVLMLQLIGKAKFDLIDSLKVGDTAKKYTEFLGPVESPLKRILNANEMKEIAERIVEVFRPLKQWKRGANQEERYPFSRVIELVRAISRDIATRIRVVLNSNTLMQLKYDRFEAATKKFLTVYGSWSECMEEFESEVIHPQQKLADAHQNQQDSQKLRELKQSHELKDLNDRIADVTELRQQHHQLQDVIPQTLKNDKEALQDVLTAYERFRYVDPLDTSAPGKDAWKAARAAYDKIVEKVEKKIRDEITRLLNKADNPSEKFRICAKFNPLFVRPEIKMAMVDSQEVLVKYVKDDIARLQERFKRKFEHSQALQMSAIRDIPQMSGEIIWVLQLERQLEVHLKNIEAVLGENWSEHHLGQQITERPGQFINKLNPMGMISRWLDSVQDIKIDNDHVFRVVATAQDAKLIVNFDPRMITVLKEYRNLQFLFSYIKDRLREKEKPKEKDAPKEKESKEKEPREKEIKEIETKEKETKEKIQNLASTAYDRYPTATRLEEALRIYMRTCTVIDKYNRAHLAPLIAKKKKEVQEAIVQISSCSWNNVDKEKVGELCRSVIDFQDLVDELINDTEKIESALHRLQNCKPNQGTLRSIMDEIHGVIRHLQDRKCSNLGLWVTALDKRVEDVLIARLKTVATLWAQALDQTPDWALAMMTSDTTGAATEEANNTAAASQNLHTIAASSHNVTTNYVVTAHADAVDKPQEGHVEMLDFVVKKPLCHEIRRRENTLFVEPPLVEARLRLCTEFQGWLAAVLELRRLATFSTVPKGGLHDDYTYRSILSSIPTKELMGCFEKIESHVQSAHEFVQSWLRYQTLLELNQAEIIAELGTDVVRWESLLMDMKQNRTAIEEQTVRRMFGPILIDYSKVQGKIIDKYNAMHRLLLNAFGTKADESYQQMHRAMTKEHEEVKTIVFEYTSVRGIWESITKLEDFKTKTDQWRKELEALRRSKQLLVSQRYQFAKQWETHEQKAVTEFSHIEQTLQHLLADMNSQQDAIIAALAQNEKNLRDQMAQLSDDWKKRRPIQDNLGYSEVKQILEEFKERADKLEENGTLLNKAKQLMQQNTVPFGQLEDIREELKGLQETWSHLAPLWKSLDDLQESLFVSVNPPDIRKKLSQIQQMLAELPNHVRQYGAVSYLKKTVQDRLDMNGPLLDLTAEVLREKHRELILKELGLSNIVWKELRVGHLWKLDLRRHQKAIRQILEQAQGEAALEAYLQEIKAHWNAAKFETVEYHKTFLVRNWDIIFEKLADHLGNLSSMKLSPFFSVFEREANEWEELLSRAQAIFDVFVDVQRRWVYLEGIFTNSQDVQVQLEFQYKRFRQFDVDFTKRLMPEIRHEPDILPWISKERSLLQIMEGHVATLNSIQKALSDYLEKQRAAFPRFYFVGDEDLLEIIGNAKNPVKVVRHLTKMFAGIAALQLSDNTQHIQGMISREGEVVPFKASVSLAQFPAIHEWLRQIEYQMQHTLAALLEDAVAEMRKLNVSSEFRADAFFDWTDRYPSQIVLLASQVAWSERVDSVLHSGNKSEVEAVAKRIEATLQLLADRILLPQVEAYRRKKYEQIITEMVHQRDITRQLIKNDVKSATDYQWLSQIRFYFYPEQKDPLKKLQICVSRATFYYGFEYLGVPEKLVQTPLTDRCYLTLCEAQHMRLGGNPFGPAGTGKTETVKALGSQLGRFVLVFNCDEAFDFQAMGRIFIGLCQCGAWGCFDEFNRLEERILSAVSQQILTIQNGLKDHKERIDLLGRAVALNDRMGIFVTMNPGYAGRSNLPDNLKQLFRSIAMIQPDSHLICEVMLFSQGFRSAEDLAGKMVLLFQLCQDQLSSQPHYDFGLRALKSVLRSAGALKRSELLSGSSTNSDSTSSGAEEHKLDRAQIVAQEQELLVRSLCETLVPKLVATDTPLFGSLLTAVFPTARLLPPKMDELRAKISELCKERDLLDEATWVDKALQVYQIQAIHHGVIMVGPSGSGKSTAWQTLLDALEKLDGVKSECYIIDPKALSKDELYGSMDSTTLEWTNGVFTATLRKIIDNARGEANKRHWIVFDGDVDPEWAENLNSVLDDNKLLTLPNGERLALSPNVRIMFEVKDLNFATPATVSRCGMVWFSEYIVSVRMIMSNFLKQLRTKCPTGISESMHNRHRRVKEDAVDYLEQFFELKSNDGATNANFVEHALEAAAKHPHIMDFDRLRVISSCFSLLKNGLAKIIEYNEAHIDFPLNLDQVNSFMSKYLVFSVLWGFAGSMSLAHRLKFCEELYNLTPSLITKPDITSNALIDYEVSIDSQNWSLYGKRVQSVDIESHKVVSPDQVIDTVDTVRHTDIVSSWLSDHRPLILCGPPGCGKSMTLTAVLRSLPQFELVTLNFSSSTKPDLLMRSFDHYCKVDRTPNGLKMRPNSKNKWLVIFCDEINLPANDAYHTQHVITFLRQIIEQGGFWRASELAFVTLENIQIIGACNPPTDAGRVPLSPRFLRHCPLIFVDFPAPPSLKQIYGTFNRALLKLTPNLHSQAEPLSDAMIEFYLRNQEHFTPDMQAHYVYSPRELSRWVRAMYEAMRPLESMTLEQLVRLWLHEALRLFQDRLVEQEERDYVDKLADEVAQKHFAQADFRIALARPVLFSNWLSKLYVSVQQDQLREHVKLRLHTFNEEELDVKLVIFDEVLEHILRIDRVLRQPLGHLLLVGASGSGKTILSKFVSWMNAMSTFQIKVHKNYAAKDFDRDLRSVLTRAGCRNEKICFIFDESNVLQTAFLERMNALLASGEVPGLFENADYKNLMVECRDAARRDGVNIDQEDELYARFCALVQRNLHVVFTMNPLNEDFNNRKATSPALFNRCVIDWFGEWSHKALYQVGVEFTHTLELGDTPLGENTMSDAYAIAAKAAYAVSNKPGESKGLFQVVPGSQRDAVVQTLVFIHDSIHKVIEHMARQHAGRSTYVTPRHYLDFIKHYANLSREKQEQLEDQKRHMTAGLNRLRTTEEEVMRLKEELTKKNRELEAKTKLANEKLNQMLVDQKEAEQKRESSIRIAKEITAKEEQITTRRDTVKKELDQIKPALEEASQSVNAIAKQQLYELQALRNPPHLVKLGLEPIVMILGGDYTSWDEVRKVLRRNDFISSILNFKTENLDPQIRKTIEEKYLSNPDFDFEKINNASRVCGPLVKWLRSQLKYSEILNSIEPYQKELKSLEDTALKLRNEQKELSNLVEELDKRIAQYKEDYAALLKEADRINTEMTIVKAKVERSERLLLNLGVERERWDSEIKNFKEQISTVVGDCLVSAAFLAYIGYFNQYYRTVLVDRWRHFLEERHVPFKENLSIIDYLSLPSERLQWQANRLPRDDLCTENAIMMARFNRYPLIIDPSGQATDFLMTHYKDRKIIRTSFLDDAFLKNLESALRFGNALLVEDVESMDPVLNSVLNREIAKTGGRVTITLGDKEIDFSPTFTIFLSTRDPTCHFTPDLCSRVTFVNFTITHSSLTAQCLSKILRTERPDVDKKFTDLLKLQGEFRVRLRSLEDLLLQALNDMQGNILDDENVMSSLEKLKTEAQDITKRMEDSERVMAETQAVSDRFRPFAVSCSHFYFTLEKMADVHFLYQFSLAFFLNVVDHILANASQIKEADPAVRVRALVKQVFWVAYQRVSRSLLNRDQIAFALRLVQLFLEGTPEEFDVLELDFLLKGKIDDVSGSEASLPEGFKLSRYQKQLLGQIFSKPNFKELAAHMTHFATKWIKFCDPLQDEKHSADEKNSSSRGAVAPIPTGWEKGTTNPQKLWQHLLVSKILRADQLPQIASSLIEEVFGDGFLDQNHTLDLKKIVYDEINSHIPLLLVSKPGYDASFRVETLAANCNKRYHENFDSFAMGSPEGYVQAEDAIKRASKNGTWVLLKNVHLAPSWLSALEKRLHLAAPHPDFRLFMTMEINPKVPVNLLRMSNMLIFEPPAGIKSSLLRTFGSISPERVDKAPAERSRLYFLLAWLHAVIMERLRYAPVGWSKTFEFSETDQICAMDSLDEWISIATKEQGKFSPEKIPWGALQALMEIVAYGGRIDNTFDQQRLSAFVRYLFTEKSFGLNYPLCFTFNAEGSSQPLLTIPNANNHEGFKKWIEDLNDAQSPEVLGLSQNAEVMLLIQHARHIETQLQILQDERANAEEISTQTKSAGQEHRLSVTTDISIDTNVRPEWMVSMSKQISAWLKRVPTELSALPRDNKAISDPLFRALEREFTIYRNLLQRIRAELKFGVDVLEGRDKPNSDARSLFKCIQKDTIPKNWRKYVVESMHVSTWIDDFVHRLETLKRVYDAGPGQYGRLPFWLGALIQPEAFIAATRQSVAQTHKWSIEQLELSVTVTTDSNDARGNADSFVFEGLTLLGAAWKAGALCISNELAFSLPPVRFTWKYVAEEKHEKGENVVQIPVYLNASRTNFLFSVPLQTPKALAHSVWSQRGTCLVVWNAHI